MVAVVFDSHVHFADIVAAFVDCLNKELLYKHLAADDAFDCRDGCIYRAVA